jgi:glucose/mannose transport system substrate-binding protein
MASVAGRALVMSALAVVLGVPLVVPACAPRVAEPPRAGRPIEVVTWWERMGDRDALGALTREYRRLDPRGVVIHANTDLSPLTRRSLRGRMLRDDPPDLFQANAGSDLLQWVRFNGMDARESKLLPLDDLGPGATGWRSQLPPAVLEGVTHDGKVYGVPSNLHRTNELFVNRKVLQKYGLEEPKTLDDLAKMGERLRGTGVPLLALGSRDPWTLSSIAFECLLVAREGAGTYREYFSGKLAPDDPRVVRTLDAALALLSLADARRDELTWLQATEQVIEGRAAMTIMGDWARLAFTAHGLEPGKDFGEVPFPGTAGVFVFTSDVFAVPAAAKHPNDARRLLATIASTEGQRAISDASGVLPARVDVAPTAADPAAVAKRDLLRTGPLVPALSGMVPGVFAGDLASALVEMVRERDVEVVVHTLRSRYALLK